MTAPQRSRGALARDIAVLACAFSAGVHAGLVPEHLHESTTLGVGFAGAAALSAVVALELRRAEESLWPPIAASVLLTGLIVAYGLSRAAGLAVLGAEREALDPLGLATKAIELAGLTCALSLITNSMRQAGKPLARRPIQEVRPR
jgi:hypothetical protein